MKPVFGLINIQADERGRIRIPALYRTSLGETRIYAYKNKKGNYLSLFGEDTLESLLSKLSIGIDVEEDEAVEDIRDIYMNIFEIVEDKQGRFTIPQYLRDELKLSKDIVFIGMGKKIEMWDKAAHDEYVQSRRQKSGVVTTADGKPLTY